MIMAALIVISLVVVLAPVRETCVSGNALGPSVGGELDLPGVHSALTFSWFSWGVGGDNIKWKDPQSNTSPFTWLKHLFLGPVFLP